MKFLLRHHREEQAGANLDRFRPKRRWRWFIVILALLLVVVLWYASTIFLAYQASHVDNTSTDSSQRLKDAVARTSAPINVLIIGVEGANYPGGLLSDSMIVASVDTKSQTISLLSLPRDLYVPIPGYGQDKLNAAHALGEQAGQKQNLKGKGPELLQKTITTTFGIPIDYFMRVDFDGFRQIIDAIDGVDVNVKTAVFDPLFPDGNGGYTTFSIKPGLQHLNGETALKYARSRETTSDFDRARRQQEIISALKDKLLTPAVLANPKKTTDLIGIAGSHFLTDVSAGEFNQIIALAKTLPNPTIQTKVLDTSAELGLLKNSTSSGGAYIIVPTAGATNFRSVAAFIQGYFASPRIKAEKTAIELVNGGVKSDVVSRVERELEWAGFTVTTVTASTPATTSALLDYQTSTPDSVKWLTSRYGIGSVATPPPSGVTTNLSLTLGTDWGSVEKKVTQKVADPTDSPFALP